MYLLLLLSTALPWEVEFTLQFSVWFNCPRQNSHILSKFFGRKLRLVFLDRVLIRLCDYSGLDYVRDEP